MTDWVSHWQSDFYYPLVADKKIYFWKCESRWCGKKGFLLNQDKGIEELGIIKTDD